MSAIRRVRGHANQVRGAAVEEVVAMRLLTLGLHTIERIYDAWIPVRKLNGREWVCARGARKLPGDIRALMDDAAVLVECKSRAYTLAYSDLLEHQHLHLRLLRDRGHVPLVAWHERIDNKLWILPYHPTLFRPGKGVNAELAERYQLRNETDAAAWRACCKTQEWAAWPTPPAVAPAPAAPDAT